jgi:hypothetical protein
MVAIVGKGHLELSVPKLCHKSQGRRKTVDLLRPVFTFAMRRSGVRSSSSPPIASYLIEGQGNFAKIVAGSGLVSRNSVTQGKPAMAFKLPAHLHRNRYGVLYFRLAIPEDLRPIFGVRECWRSLGTSSVREASLTAQTLKASL